MATSYIHWLYCKNLYESKMTGGNGYVNLVSFLCVFVARGTSIWLGTGTRNSYNATSSKGHQHNSQLTAFFVLQKTNTCRYLRLKFDFGSSQLCPKSYVPSHLRSIRTISTAESMEVGTYHFTQDPKSYVPTMTWMPTWQHFLEVRLGTCVESWVEQKGIVNITCNRSPEKCFFS